MDKAMLPGDSSMAGWLAIRFRAVRAFSLPVSVLPVAVATAAVLPVSQWNWPVLIAAMLAAGLLHCAGNLFNDYFDFRNGVDRSLEGNDDRPGLVLVRKLMTPRQVAAEGGFCMVAVGVLAAYIVWACRPWGVNLLWFALAGAVSLYIYTGPPLALKYHAMGELLIFVTFGPLLLVGAAYAQTGRLELAALLASAPVGLATTAILVGNNIRDKEEDRSSGIVTLSQVIGHGRLRAVYVALVVSSVLGLAGMAAFGLMPRVLVGAPVLLVLAAKPLTAVLRDRRLSDIDARTAKFETAMLLAMIAAMVADKW
ncbi:MAG: prenyltransferase [Phycisphaerae bacterium]